MADKAIETLKKELEQSKEEVRSLRNNYENQVAELREEIGYLKEQLYAQQSMLQTAISHADKISKELKGIKKKVDKGDFQGIH